MTIAFSTSEYVRSHGRDPSPGVKGLWFMRAEIALPGGETTTQEFDWNGTLAEAKTHVRNVLRNLGLRNAEVVVCP